MGPVVDDHITLLLSLPSIFLRAGAHGLPQPPDPGRAVVFDDRLVQASSPAPFARSAAPAVFPYGSRAAPATGFEDLLAGNGTRAMVVLHHDVIVYERYFGDVTAETRLPSFSMSKTFAAVLVSCALDDRLLASTQQRLAEETCPRTRRAAQVP